MAPSHDAVQYRVVDIDDADDDDLSVTSTINEEHDSEEEWLVKEILAERKIDSESQYLVLWEGFDLQDATWEPRHHLQPSILVSWKATKTENGKANAPGFEVRMWRDAKLKEIRRQFAKRNARNKKRARLGLKQHFLDYTLKDCIEELDAYVNLSDGNEDKCAKRVGKEASPVHSDMPLAPQLKVYSPQKGKQNKQDASKNSANRGHGTGRPGPEPETAATSADRPGNTSTHNLSRATYQATPRDIRVGVDEGTPIGLANRLKRLRRKPSPFIASQNLPYQTTGRTQTGNVTPEDLCNVFAGGKERKQKTTLLDVSSDPTKPPQFLNARRQRLIQKGIRDKEGTRGRPLRPSRPPRPGFAGHSADVASTTELSAARDRKESAQATITGNPDQNNLLRLGPASAGLINAVQSYNNQTGGKTDFTEDDASMRKEESSSRTMVKKKRRVTFNPELELVPHGWHHSEQENKLFVTDETQDSAIVPDRQESWILAERSIVSEGLGYHQAPMSKTLCLPRLASDCETIGLNFLNISSEDRNTDWFRSFNASDEIVLTHLCTAADLLLHVGSEQLKQAFAWTGPISTAGTDHHKAKELSERLSLVSLAAKGRLSASHIVLILPSRCPDWEEVYNTCDATPRHGIALSCIVLRMDEDIGAEAMASTVAICETQQGGKTFDLYLLRDHEVLQSPRGVDAASHNVFLAFPPEASQDMLLVIQWIHSCKPECKIRSSLQPGQWASFVQGGSGHLIIHDNAISIIRQIPNLSDILHIPKSRFAIWRYSCASENRIGQWTADGNCSRLCIVRLDKILSSGTAFLASPSFFVAQPEQSYTFLKWFWQKFRNTDASRSRIRLVVWDGITEWLLKLGVEKARSIPGSKGSPAWEPSLSFSRASESACDAIFKSYLLMNELKADTELTGDGPLVLAPDVIHGDDEQSLVNWFGHWSLNHIEDHRKFFVLGSSDHGRSRVTRSVQPVEFAASTTLEPLQMEYAGQPDTDTLRSTNGTLLYNDSGQEIWKFLTGVQKSFAGLDFCPLILYRYPVAYTCADMALRFLDYKSEFVSYAKWFSFFAKPFFIRFRSATAGKYHRSHKNTYLGLFYTPDGEWDELSMIDEIPKRRHPWIVAYRPTDIHRCEWSAMELFIWDPLAASHYQNVDNGITEADLIPAQRELVKHVRQTTQNSSVMLPLERVWLGGYNSGKISEFGEPLDAALDWIRNVSSCVKEWLPTSRAALPGRGWRRIDSPIGTHVGGAHYETNEGAGYKERAVKQKMASVICHPPPGDDESNNLSRCINLFSQAMPKQRGESMVQYTFPRTLDWYDEQLAEGRGFQHITVTTWESIFKRYGIDQSERKNMTLHMVGQGI